MLKLVKLDTIYKNQFFDMMQEWEDSGEKVVPFSIVKNNYRDFDNYINTLDQKNATDFYVPDSTFFCLDTSQNKFVGAVNIRHYLNETLLRKGGHIGDGVVPSERRKGIATKMITLAKEECKELQISRILMVCNKENIASAKSIINNGGILENEITEYGTVFQRYWIDNN